MLYESLHEFALNIIPGQRLLGLDIGLKKIGIALSDTTHLIATPYDTLLRKSFAKDIGTLCSIMDTHYVCGIVAGLPITMMGIEGSSSHMAREFIAKLIKQRAISCYLHDERFSTAAVNRALSETNLTRQKKAALDDKMAASYILQGALDQLRFGR
jgi:putative Holliday junction resolvase